METTTRTINFKQQVEQVIKGYETDPAKGLVHGCTKDWIQNGWGHRQTKKGKGWSFVINYVNNDHGEFLVLEDCGATGLVGKNYSQKEINKMMDEGIVLDANEKLARFCSLYNSGGNTDSAGLFGRGKLMYQAASKSLSYYFDSYTKNKNYIANKLEGNTILKLCLEEEEAKNFILNNTGLSPKTTCGTRIIIENPKDEIVQDLKNGKMIQYINETWWKTIQKYNAEIIIKVDDAVLYKAEVPEVYRKYYANNKKSHVYENITYKDLVAKKVGFILVDDASELGEDLENISYYRVNMKIGDVYQDIDSLPIEEEYRHRIAGFIEVDETWEEMLQKNENLEHYGPVNKRAREFQGLKTIIKTKLDDFAELMGIKKKRGQSHPNEELEKLANDFTDFLLDNDIKLDWKPSKKQKNKKPIEILLEKQYPNEGKRTLEYNQKISFKYILKKRTKEDVEIALYVVDENNKKKELSKKIIKFENDFESNDIELNYDDFYKGQRNLIYVKATLNDANKTSDYSTFPVYVGIDEIESQDDIVFKLENMQLPTVDSRSVYKDEKITDIKLYLKNNLNVKVILGVSSLVQDVLDRNNTIENFYRDSNIELNPDEVKIIEIGDLVFGNKYYDRKGQMKIRFNLSHVSGIPNKRKGEKINSIGVSIIFEDEQVDDAINLFNVHTRSLKDKYIKSKLSGSALESYTLDFNMDYVMYKSIIGEGQESLLYKMFTLEEMCKAIISKLNLENLDYDIINCTEEEYNELSAQDVLVRISETVDKLLGLYFEMR